MDDPHNLARFVDAQAETFAAARAELQAGHKRSHWMWFMFPQVAGLGSSPTARHYAIHSIAEAHAYLAHPVLGARLEELINVLLEHADIDIVQILGPIDAMKFRSSMTLFNGIRRPEQAIFQQAIDIFYNGEGDPFTLEWLASSDA